jgi:hypothetical protein
MDVSVYACTYVFACASVFASASTFACAFVRARASVYMPFPSGIRLGRYHAALPRVSTAV